MDITSHHLLQHGWKKKYKEKKMVLQMIMDAFLGVQETNAS